MVDLSHKTIKELFYKQIRDMTVKRDHFDVQFSDQWMKV